MNEIKHKYKFKDGDAAILNMIPVSDVLYRFGIETEKRGKNIVCLCPAHDHNDEHFGSCVVWEDTNRVHCYACGKTFDPVAIAKEQGHTFLQSLDILASLLDDDSMFLTDRREKEKQETKERFPDRPTRLTKIEMGLIGLNMGKSAGKMYISFSDHKIPDALHEDVRLADTGWEYASYKKTDSALTVFNRLYEEDFRTYKDIALSKAEEAMERYLENTKECLRYATKEKTREGYDFWIAESKEQQKKAEDAFKVYKRYGGNPEKIKNLKMRNFAREQFFKGRLTKELFLQVLSA